MTIALTWLQKQPRKVLYKKAGLLEILQYSQEYTKKSDMKSCNIIKKRHQHKCFPVNIAKFLRTPILKNICEVLLLYLLEHTRYDGNGPFRTNSLFKKKKDKKGKSWKYKPTNAARRTWKIIWSFNFRPFYMDKSFFLF